MKKPSMERLHVVLDKDVAADLEKLLQSMPISKTKFVNWACKEGMRRLQLRDAGSEVRLSGLTSKATTKATAKAAPKKKAKLTGPIQPRYEDGIAWFSLKDLCDTLGVDKEEFENQLDMGDDSRLVDDEVCVADLGVQTAIAMALGQGRDPDVIAAFEAWVADQQNNAPPGV